MVQLSDLKMLLCELSRHMERLSHEDGYEDGYTAGLSGVKTQLVTCEDT
jgi:hypothetical protein